MRILLYSWGQSHRDHVLGGTFHGFRWLLFVRAYSTWQIAYLPMEQGRKRHFFGGFRPLLRSELHGVEVSLSKQRTNGIYRLFCN